MKKVLKKPQSSRPQPASSETANRLRFFTERKDAITETIRQLVEIESPSDNKPAVDQLGALLAGRFEKIGGHAKFHRVPNFGDHLQVDFSGGATASRCCCWATLTRCIPWERSPPCPAEWPTDGSGGRARSI